MRKAIFTTLAACLAGGSLALAQSPMPLSHPAPPMGEKVVILADGLAARDMSPTDSLPCDDGCAACPSGYPGYVWASADYLLWSIKGTRLPPLATLGPTANGGVLGSPGTFRTLGGDFDYQDQSGGRFTAGVWFHQYQDVGLEGTYFFLGRDERNFAASGTGLPGTPLLARPFFNAQLPGFAADAVPIAVPSLSAGTLLAQATSEFQGWELNGVFNVGCGCNYRLDLLAGFRYMQLDEGLGVAQSTTANPAPAATALAGRLSVLDQIDTHSQFYGGQLGTRLDVHWRNLFVTTTAKFALGGTHEVVAINGSRTLSIPPLAPVTAAGGFFAQRTNSGRSDRDVFSFVPEIGVNLGCKLTEHLRAQVGYSLLYTTDVVRPNGQIERVLNLSQAIGPLGAGTLVGPARPALRMRDTDFWAQGVNFGLEYRF